MPTVRLMDSRLQDAARALAHDQPEQALVLLLDAWRRRPAAALAGLIDEVSRRAVATRPAIDGKTGSAKATVWLARAKERRPDDFERLADAMLVTRKKLDIVARLSALRAWPPDPRVARLVHALLDAPPTNDRDFWSTAFELLDGAGDPRSIAVLERLGRRLADVCWPSLLHWVEQQRARTLKLLRRRFAGGPPKPFRADAPLIAQLVKQLRGETRPARTKARTRASLLRDIYEHPDDDGRRQVFGDWLQEQGDPLGEFIALQYRRRGGRGEAARAAREALLARTHGRAWLGPLAPVVLQKGLRFERGFPAVCHVGGSKVALRRAIGLPAWATVSQIVGSMYPWHQETLRLVTHPVLRSLRAVYGFGAGWNEECRQIFGRRPHEGRAGICVRTAVEK